MTKYYLHFAVSEHPIVYENDQEVGFYEGPFNGFNNYSAHSVTIWGHWFMTSEHAYHWTKFPDYPEIRQAILECQSADASKQLVKRYADQIRPDWLEVRREVMREVITAKHDQHSDVRKQLEKSGNRIIVENSPRDDYWGVGKNRNGQNVLGELWMELRAQRYGNKYI